MKMGKPSYLLILITSWFLLELTLSEKEISLLPTNMKVHLYPGLVKITWDCNITESMKKYTYYILLDDRFDERLNVSACIFESNIPKHMEFSIHSGFNAEIHAPHINETKKLTAMPEGKENSAAKNFSCEVYVSIVNCSWTAGREAPKDTQYSLVFRGRNNNSIPCKDYRNDYFGRQVGCVLKSPNMSFDFTYYIELVGSSNETSIQFYDELLILKEYVILDPPRNIRLNYSLNKLEVTWEKPETYSKLGGDCFEYNININGVTEKSFTATDKEPHSYTKAIVLENKNLMVSMRAKLTCPDKEKWSRWSEPLIYVPSSGSMTLAAHHHLTILGIVTAAVLFILIFLCHRYRIWKKLFPKIPQPAMKFFDRAEQKQFWDQNIVGESQPKKGDDEECICSPITEISQKDQLQIMA